MMRPSGKLKRFMSNADYQVSAKRTKKKNSPFGQRKKNRLSTPALTKSGLRRLNVAPAPFKLLPNYAKERCVWQRGQWKRFLCFPDGDDRSTLNMDGSAAVQRQVNGIIGMTRFDFDHRSIRDNDRAIGENVRADRRDDEHPGLRVENRSSGRQRIGGRACGSRDNQSVGIELRERLAVDSGAQHDQARKFPAAQDGVV